MHEDDDDWEGFLDAFGPDELVQSFGVECLLKIVRHRGYRMHLDEHRRIRIPWPSEMPDWLRTAIDENRAELTELMAADFLGNWKP